MREFTRGTAKTLAYIYVFFTRHKYACILVILLCLLLSPVILSECRHMMKVQAASEILLDDILQIEAAKEDYLTEWLYVMVDAGHGGKDPGANYGDIYEKDITLAVAKKVAAALEAQNIKVIMTREDDTFVDKYDRARMANAAGVDLFVSIHVNDLKQTSYSGIETYAGHWKRSGLLLAQCIHEETVKAVSAKDLGVDVANYVVVKYTEMPSALIEIGYMSNEEERTKLQSNAYQQMLADGIVNGILEYAEQYMGPTEQ